MLRLIGRFWFWLFGWTVEPNPPDAPKFVVIASPHTSYWDLPFTVAYGWLCAQPFHWMGKREIFRFPFRWFFRMIGGIPVDRRAPQGLVQQMVDRFAERDRLWLIVPPKGTRAPRPYWKSGFYAIAYAAKVPVAPGYLDFGARRAGVAPLIELTGDVSADMDKIRAAYAGMKGKRPALQSQIRLRAEDDEEARLKLLGKAAS